jgi:hypothetical protein
LYRERLLLARNYLLYLFQKDRFVRRADVNELAHLPSNLSKNLFEEIAFYEEEKGWRLKLDPDMEFTRKHIEVMNKQNQKIDREGKT